MITLGGQKFSICHKLFCSRRGQPWELLFLGTSLEAQLLCIKQARTVLSPFPERYSYNPVHSYQGLVFSLFFSKKQPIELVRQKDRLSQNHCHWHQLHNILRTILFLEQRCKVVTVIKSSKSRKGSPVWLWPQTLTHQVHSSGANSWVRLCSFPANAVLKLPLCSLSPDCLKVKYRSQQSHQKLPQTSLLQ